MQTGTRNRRTKAKIIRTRKSRIRKPKSSKRPDYSGRLFSLSKNLNIHDKNERLKVTCFILLLTIVCSLLLCRTLRGVTFLRRKVTKSRRAAARNPQGLGGGAFESLCKAETSYAPSYPQRIVTNGAPARPPSDRYLAKFGGSCISMTASKCRHELPCKGCKLCLLQVATFS